MIQASLNYNAKSPDEFWAMLEKLRGIMTVQPSVMIRSDDLIARNRAYLTSRARGRTPRVMPKEIELREGVDGINWNDLQARDEALRAKGYDVFSQTRDKEEGTNESQNGETFDGEIDLNSVPV